MTPIEWLQIIPLIVTAASAISAVTPTKKDDKIMRKIKAFIDLLSLNVGHAKTSESVQAENDHIRDRRKTDGY